MLHVHRYSAADDARYQWHAADPNRLTDLPERHLRVLVPEMC
jgi:hypothetical protein